MKKLLLSLLLSTSILSSYSEVLVYSHHCQSNCYKAEDELGGVSPMTYAATLMNADLNQLKQMNKDRYWIIVSQKCVVQSHTFGDDIAICTAIVR